MSRLSFGEFTLETSARELRQGDRVLSLTPKAYQLLEILVTSRPKALSKFALQEALWPDTFVLDKNLVNLVAEIRRTLRDDPSKPRFVRTVQRFGYAFQAPMADEAGSTGEPVGVRFRLTWPGGHAQLAEGEHVLGRDPDLQLFFDSPGVSRRHARIRLEGERMTIEDLGSKNGTFIADRRIESPCTLQDGDLIRVGALELTFSALRAPASTRSLR